MAVDGAKTGATSEHAVDGFVHCGVHFWCKPKKFSISKQNPQY